MKIVISLRVVNIVASAAFLLSGVLVMFGVFEPTLKSVAIAAFCGFSVALSAFVMAQPKQ